MLRKLRFKLIELLSLGKPVVMNVRLLRPLYIANGNDGGYFYRVYIDKSEEILPEDVGIYLAFKKENDNERITKL
jgi:hypothetical protein